MDGLLRWSIQNSTPLDEAARNAPLERKDLDPGIIDMILGRPDSELMKEDMAIATDASRDEDDRVNALDHFEMLIEQIDNANNIEKLHLWEPLQSLLSSETSTPDIVMQSLWVIGTAIQNNPAAQDVYLSFNPLPTLLAFLTPNSSLQVRSKAIYVLSGLLRHNTVAVKALSTDEVNGWVKLRDSLQDPDISVRRKTVFLLSALLIPEGPVAASPQTQSPVQEPLRITDNPNPTNAAVTAHPSLSLPDAGPEPVHANSHASHLRNPASTATSQLTLEGIRTHGILDVVISAITEPLPHGEDGDNLDVDPDFEEKAVRLLYIYAVSCNGEISSMHRQSSKAWLEKQVSKEGLGNLSDSWNLTIDEIRALISRIH